MTDTALKLLYDDRQRLLKLTAQQTGVLGLLSPVERQEVDVWSAGFRQADAAITAELRKRDGPAALKGVTLHLTRDRLNFVALVPGTECPLHLVGYKDRDTLAARNTLYEYPRNGRK